MPLDNSENPGFLHVSSLYQKSVIRISGKETIHADVISYQE